MPTRTLVGPFISVTFAITLSALLLAGCPEHVAQNPVPSCGQSGPSPLSFHANDAHLKHHVLAVTGTQNGSSTSSVQWCNLDNPAVSFTIAFPDGSPIGVPSLPSTVTVGPSGTTNCTIAASIVVKAQNHNHIDGYRYTITGLPQGSIDPHVIVVGGN
jgi:hypothetical protein